MDDALKHVLMDLVELLDGDRMATQRVLMLDVGGMTQAQKDARAKILFAIDDQHNASRQIFQRIEGLVQPG